MTAEIAGTSPAEQNGGQAIRVLIADDQVLIRAGLAALIAATAGMRVVGQAADGREAVELAASLLPDVVLMDMRMPGIDGVAATERILAQAKRPPRILVLTTFDLDEYVYGALRAGACGFLLKDAPPERILAAITAAAAGDLPFAPAIARRLVDAYASAAWVAEQPRPEVRVLTDREHEVLCHVATGRTNAEIAGDLHLSEATVKTHLNRLMTKLGLSSRAQAVVFAYESGLVNPGLPGAR